MALLEVKEKEKKYIESKDVVNLINSIYTYYAFSILGVEITRDMLLKELLFSIDIIAMLKDFILDITRA